MNVTKMDLRPEPEPQWVRDDILEDLNTIANMIPQDELRDMVVNGINEIIRLRNELSVAHQELQRASHQ
jgi:hypothetical protein